MVIPGHILKSLTDDLSAKELALLSLIQSLNKNGNRCFCSNEFIGGFLNVSDDRASHLITSLKKKGILIDNGSNQDGSDRELEVTWKNDVIVDGEKHLPPSYNSPSINGEKHRTPHGEKHLHNKEVSNNKEGRIIPSTHPTSDFSQNEVEAKPPRSSKKKVSKIEKYTNLLWKHSKRLKIEKCVRSTPLPEWNKYVKDNLSLTKRLVSFYKSLDEETYTHKINSSDRFPIINQPEHLEKFYSWIDRKLSEEGFENSNTDYTSNTKIEEELVDRTFTFEDGHFETIKCHKSSLNSPMVISDNEREISIESNNRATVRYFEVIESNDED